MFGSVWMLRSAHTHTHTPLMIRFENLLVHSFRTYREIHHKQIDTKNNNFRGTNWNFIANFCYFYRYILIRYYCYVCDFILCVSLSIFFFGMRRAVFSIVQQFYFVHFSFSFQRTDRDKNTQKKSDNFRNSTKCRALLTMRCVCMVTESKDTHRERDRIL